MRKCHFVRWLETYAMNPTSKHAQWSLAVLLAQLTFSDASCSGTVGSVTTIASNVYGQGLAVDSSGSFALVVS